eukprot:GHVN01060690.1.p1 GENE.GHVN01060690.1~~GHVN01060690.1.p1  ORF type:complete len:310 (-),score=36.15 GHVN01060690.1:327-1256(-)
MATPPPPASFLAPPEEIYGRCVGVAIKKQGARWDARIWHGFMAGFWIALGSHTAISCGGGVQVCDTNGCSDVMGPGPQKLLFMTLFPAGLIAVIMFGSDLFTSNCSVMLQGVLQGRVVWWQMLLNWLHSFFLNLCGSMFVAYFLSYLTDSFASEPYLSYVQRLAITKAVSLEPHQIILRAIGCNILVNTAVWQALGTRDVAGKVLVIWLPIVAFGVAGFEHVVANQYFLPLSLMYGSSATVGDVALALTLACIGNWIGAVCFVAVPTWWLYHNDYNAKNPPPKELDEQDHPSDVKISSSDPATSAVAVP